MLEHKGIDTSASTCRPCVSRVLMRAFGFSGNRVPAMKIDGRKVQGSRNISRELDAVQPDPPLFPADPAAARGRRGGRALGRRGLPADAAHDHLVGAEAAQVRPDELSRGSRARRRGFGMPSRVAVATSGPILRRRDRMNDSTDETVRQTLAAIGPALDHIDGLIERGRAGRRAAERGRLPDRRRRWRC